jgi:hypothetical protein
MDTKYDRLLGKYGTLSHNVDELLGKKIKTKKLPKDFTLKIISEEERIKDLIKEANK